MSGVARYSTCRRGAAVAVFALGLCVAGCTGLSQKERTEIDRIVERLADDTVVESPGMASALYELAGAEYKDPIHGRPAQHVALLDAGIDALVARIHLIRSARTSIDIQTFIWVDDIIGRLLYHELLIASRRGVRVRVLMDQFCKITDPRIMARAATAHRNPRGQTVQPHRAPVG